MRTGAGFWAGVGVGVLLALAGGALALGTGFLGSLQVEVPVRAVVPLFRAGARSALGHGLDAVLAQAVVRQVGPVLAGVSISVDGVSVHLSPAARRRIAARVVKRVVPAVRRAARQWVDGPGLVRALDGALRPRPLDVVTRVGPGGLVEVKVRLLGPRSPSSVVPARARPEASGGGRGPFIAGQKWRVL